MQPSRTWFSCQLEIEFLLGCLKTAVDGAWCYSPVNLFSWSLVYNRYILISVQQGRPGDSDTPETASFTQLPLTLESRYFVKKRFILLIVLEGPCMMLSVTVW